MMVHIGSQKLNHTPEELRPHACDSGTPAVFAIPSSVASHDCKKDCDVDDAGLRHLCGENVRGFHVFPSSSERISDIPMTPIKWLIEIAYTTCKSQSTTICKETLSTSLMQYPHTVNCNLLKVHKTMFRSFCNTSDFRPVKQSVHKTCRCDCTGIQHVCSQPEGQTSIYNFTHLELKQKLNTSLYCLCVFCPWPPWSCSRLHVHGHTNFLHHIVLTKFAGDDLSESSEGF